MPGLQPECIQTAGQTDEHCCICEENKCPIALSSRGDTILFADGEEAITEGNRCDCIVVLRRGSVIEVYSIELKGISNNTNKGDALNPDRLKQKWENCLKWTLDVVSKFNSVSEGGFEINIYVVLVVPEEVRRDIATLIKRQSLRYKPRISDAGRIQGRILSCNSSITSYANIF